MFDSSDLEFGGLSFKQVIDTLEKRLVSTKLAVQNDDFRYVVDDVAVLVFSYSKRVRNFILILDKHVGPNVIDGEVKDSSDD